jgi:small subunit ribosomal protein S1
MPAQYDEQGNYVYPEGWDPETEEWREGYEAQREEWEQQYATAWARFEAHRRQVAKARSKAREASHADSAASSGEQRMLRRQRRSARGGRGGIDNAPSGALVSDEALAALRDKLSGGQS